MGMLDQIEKQITGRGVGRIAVVAAHDEAVIQSLIPLYKKGLIQPTLIGNRDEIFRIADELGMDLSQINIIKETDPSKCAEIGVGLVGTGEADIIMKGHLQTADLLRAVLEKEKGLRTGNLLSHCGVFEMPGYHKLLLVTDAGINIAPDLKQKMQIIQNAVTVMHSLDVERPKVAVLAAVELVNPAMPATLDAAALAKMAQRGQIGNCVVDGPLAMDNAVSLEAAKEKHIVSDVAGDADILLVPDIEAGNIMVKALVFLYNARTCGVITGAKVPLVVTSRADSSDTKHNSILLALAMMQGSQLKRS